MKKNIISFKEEVFCQYFTKLTNVREAAAKSGYSLDRGLKLISENRILERCFEIASGELSPRLLAVQSLKRLAFGTVNDGVALAINPDGVSKEDLERLDLFAVESISRSKAGQLDIRFYDRLKAIQLLLESTHQKDQPEDLSGILTALNSSAKVQADSEAL